MDRAHALRVADELDAFTDNVPVGALAGVGGPSGLVAQIRALSAAARAGDVAALGAAFKDVIDSICGAQAVPADAQAALGGGRFDWAKLIDVLVKVLPLLLRTA